MHRIVPSYWILYSTSGNGTGYGQYNLKHVETQFCIECCTFHSFARNQINYSAIVCCFNTHFRREQDVLLHVPQFFIYDSIWGCTNLRHLITQVSKFFAMAPNIFSVIMAIFPCTQKCVSSLTLNRIHWMTVRSTGYSRVVGPQLETCFM
jgi:hypothetical protein